MSRILIIGESGQLAQSLRRLQWPQGLDPAFHGRRSLGDRFAPDRVPDLIRTEAPVLVLNAAAYTAVDRAESEPHAAQALNAGLPRALAEACRAHDVPLIHVSTDYVFDGQKRSPYLESDAPNPLNVYGKTKLAGDLAIEQAAPRRWAILRASWVVSEIGDTFPVKLLRRARAGETLRVVDDQWGCPTAALDLARAVRDVAIQLLDDGRAACGLFNFCGAAEMSWHGFAQRVLTAAQGFGMKPPRLQTITTSELQAPARRPAYSVLSCAAIEQTFGLPPATIDDELDRMVRSILAG